MQKRPTKNKTSAHRTGVHDTYREEEQDCRYGNHTNSMRTLVAPRPRRRWSFNHGWHGRFPTLPSVHGRPYGCPSLAAPLLGVGLALCGGVGYGDADGLHVLLVGDDHILACLAATDPCSCSFNLSQPTHATVTMYFLQRPSPRCVGLFSERLWLVGCLTSQQHASICQGRICTILRAATLRQKLQTKLSASPIHSILTPG